ncbi:MAG: hypothetical protein RR320_01960 [Oscillospiraceae bacterium]
MSKSFVKRIFLLTGGLLVLLGALQLLHAWQDRYAVTREVR